ncbi:MAG: DUF2461 domain-containing protein [Gammaproteobacteria bacterium]|nr:DUF2461 domain-containing protein [Gammaproteobacteria bacterium]
MPAFKGFPAETLKFLDQLAANNRREWFDDNKDRYEFLVREPALDFITAMEKPLTAIAPHFVAVPKKVGGSLMRVYKDTRFSRDKTPYKTNIGIQFRHETGKDVHAPGYYVHIESGECFLGVGLWHPDAEPLAAIRTRIAERSGEWLKIRDQKAFASSFQLGGSTLTRPPRGFGADHPAITDIKRKDFIAGHDFGAESIFSADLVKQVAATFKTASPFMKFLCQALDLPF